MNKNALHWLGHSLVAVAAAALLPGCADEAPVGPDGRSAFAAQHVTPPAGQSSVVIPAALGNDAREVDLGPCENLRVPAGSKLAFRVYAEGVQVYHWNGTSWSFDGPVAALSADANGRSTVGTHYAGPTWESASGGKLFGTVLQRCTPDP